MSVPPADTQDCGGTYDEHVSFPLTQVPFELPVPRPARRRLAQQSDRHLVNAVKVSAVMIYLFIEYI